MGLLQNKHLDQWGVFPNTEAQRLLEGILQSLPRRANILLVGNKTANPLGEKSTTTGHEVHSVNSTVSLKDHSPKTSFEAIVVVFSLYHLSRAETYTQVFKLCEWLRLGDQLLLATSVPDAQD